MMMGLGLQAQVDSIQPLRNVVRLNLTPTLISGSRSWVVGYERVLSNHRSFSVNAGRVEFPVSIGWSDSSLVFGETTRSNGFSLAADYRFYFKNKNKEAAPSGLYWAPFALYYYFDQEHSFYYDNQAEEVRLSNRVNAFATGVEVGYQLTLGKHWTVDMIFLGPAYGFYTLDVGIESTYPNSFTESQLWDLSRDFLEDSYPNVVKSFENGSFDTKGYSFNWGFNFRYVLQIGYRF